VWWFKPVILALGRLRQEDNKVKASMIRSCLKKKKKERKGQVPAAHICNPSYLGG
jgi:hypothetical protein